MRKPPETTLGSSFACSASWENLQRRATLLAEIRKWFEQHGFLEVETPLLSADTVIDRHLDPVSVILPYDPAQPERGRPMWLQTSPEFGMKRLLACGATAIYQVTRSFRLGEVGPLHNPEFTMLEWYRAGDDMNRGMAFLCALCQHLLQRGPAERLSYQQAFLQLAGVDPLRASTAELAAVVRKRQIDVPADSHEQDRDLWLDLLLTECVQPNLGVQRPTILYDYPAHQAALARVRPGDPPVAERFELYVDGMELANGYHELCDADTLVQRNRQTNQQRTQDGKRPLPEHSRLIEAMRSGIPDCTGVALGFDRLVMQAVGARTIQEVMTFPVDRA